MCIFIYILVYFTIKDINKYYTSKYEKEYHDKLQDGFAIVYEIDKVANEAIDKIRELSNELDVLFKR